MPGLGDSIRWDLRLEVAYSFSSELGMRPLMERVLSRRDILKALGGRVGDPDLHAHRFRHSFTMNALRSGMKEPMLRLIGGWKKIPETYMRTLAIEDAARELREISLADRLGEALQGQQKRQGRGQPRWRL